MKIGFLGLGKMGAPMASGCWRPARIDGVESHRERAEALAQEGASRGHAGGGGALHDAVMTMLFDDAAHEEVLFGPEGLPVNGLLGALPPGALHISLSTISVALSERLTEEHARRGTALCGRAGLRPAQRGRRGQAVDRGGRRGRRGRPGRARCWSRCRAASRWWASEPRQAHALKLGGNFLISAMIHSLSESFVYRGVAGHRARKCFLKP